MTTEQEARRALDHVRRICLAFPEVSERLSHGTPSFFIRGKKTLAMFADDHHEDGILGLWCPAWPGVQAEMIDAEPDRFYRPPYVGPAGWLGIRLDRSVDWDEVAAILADSYRKVAPKTLARLLDEPTSVADEGGVDPCDSAMVSAAEPAEQAKRDLDATRDRTIR